ELGLVVGIRRPWIFGEQRLDRNGQIVVTKQHLQHGEEHGLSVASGSVEEEERVHIGESGKEATGYDLNHPLELRIGLYALEKGQKLRACRLCIVKHRCALPDLVLGVVIAEDEALEVVGTVQDVE